MDNTSAQVDMANAQANLESAIASAAADHHPDFLSTPASSPVPEAPAPVAAPATPATEQTAQPVAEPVAQPEGIKPEGQTTALPDLNTLPADLKKALELYGGDPDRAAKGFLETNTRNAQMAAKLREAGIDPKTLTPYPKPVAPEVPVTPPDEVAIRDRAQGLLDRDTVFQQLRTQYMEAETEKTQVMNSLAEIGSRRNELQAYLKHPTIKADTFLAEEYKSELQQLELRELTLSTRSLHLDSKQEALNARAAKRSEIARRVVEDDFKTQFESQQDAIRDAELQAEAEAEWETAFPVAVDQAMAQFQIPAELQGKLISRARAFGLMQDGPIEDIHGFVRDVAKQMHDELDTFHRLQAGKYAQAAIQRSQQPVPSVPTVAAYAQPSNYTNLVDHEANLAKQLGEFMRG